MKLERLLNLTAALLDTERLLPASEIHAKVAGYAAATSAFRRTFERDKADLRRMGIPLTMGSVPGTDPPVEGYRIRKQDYYLPDPNLEPDERAALHLAARTVRLEGTSPEAAFWALGGAPAHGEAVAELSVLPSDPNLALAYRAISERRPVRFDYRGPERSVEPLRLHFARGHWYLSGYDRDRRALRHFRLDRIGEMRLGSPRGFTPADLPAGDLERPPWEIGGEVGEAELAVDADVADWVLAQTGEGLGYRRRPDGSLLLTVPVANPAALMDFLLGLLDHAELLSPPELRGELLARVRAVVQARPADAPGVREPEPPATPPDEAPAGALRVDPAVEEPAPARAARATSLNSLERLQRLLQIIPWVAGSDGARLDDITERFDYPPGELLDDLQRVVFMVGVPPYTPDALIEVEIEEGWVRIHFADFFRRPLRLTPPQAVALVVAATSLLEVAADSALERGLAKLARCLGVNPAEAVVVHLGAAGAEVLEALQACCAAGEVAEIGYYSYARDAHGDRVIEPHRIFANEGAWYVRAHCRTAGGPRTFRLDRIARVSPTGETFVPPPGEVSALVWDPPADAPWVELLLEPEALWVLDYYPTTRRTWHGERCLARLEVGGVPWLERLLVRLGPAAQVVAGEGVPADAGPAAARRILARYGE